MKLIIGLGTGRCGTVSLSKFFKKQEGFFAVHEGLFSFIPYRQKLLPWELDDKKYNSWKELFLKKSKGFSYGADIGSYFLPYVEKILNDFPDTKFICLERPKFEVVKSFITKTVGRNHWMIQRGRFEFGDSVWDAIHPKLSAQNKKEALEMYWDMYHKQASLLAMRYPNQFKIFSYEALNSKDGRESILDFIGFEGKRVVGGDFRYNSNRGSFFEFIKRIIWDIRIKFFS
jgi:hypothetical protein